MPQIVNKKSVLEMAMGAIAEITDYAVCARGQRPAGRSG